MKGALLLENSLFPGNQPTLLLPGPRPMELNEGADNGGDQHRGPSPPHRQVEQVRQALPGRTSDPD